MFNWFRNLFKSGPAKIERPAEWPELPINNEQHEYFEGETYIIGDSHAYVPFRYSNYFTGVSIGPRTAHRLDLRENELIQNLKSRPAGSKFIFLFGEIDCRVHFFSQQYKQNRPVRDLILDTAEKYIMLIKRLRRRGFDIAIMSVFPTGDMPNPAMTYFGSPAQRREITKQFNAQLKQLCVTHGIPFVDIYNALVNSKGWRRKELIKDDVHLNEVVDEILDEHLERHWWMYN